MIHGQLISPHFWRFAAWLTLQLPWAVPVLMVALVLLACFDAISTKMALKKARFGVHELNPVMQWLMDWSRRIGFPDAWMLARVAMGLFPAAVLGGGYYAWGYGAGLFGFFVAVAIGLGLIVRNNYSNAWRWPGGQKPY
jgi:hypothetical protein